MKAYGYCRCSGIGQMDGDGPTRQRDAIQKFATTRGLEIVAWFMESHTGTDLEGRPEFQKMRQELVSDGVRTVIVERIDRLARDIMIQETILADFRKNGIELKSATPGEEDLCGNDPTRTLIRQILGCFAQYERTMIISKLNAGRARKRAKGEHAEGVYPFGSKPGESTILDHILDCSRDGFQPSQTARLLNDLGYKTRYGKRWHSGTISKILRRHKECETSVKGENV